MVDLEHSAHHNSVVHCKQNLAILYNRTGRASEARALFEEVVEALETYYDRPHPDTADAHGAYGDLLMGIGDLAGAEHQFRTALQMKESVFGAQSPQVGRSLAALGIALTYEQKYTQARPVLQRAVDVLEASRQGPAVLGEAYRALANAQHSMGNAKAAEKAARRSDYYRWLARQGRA